MMKMFELFFAILILLMWTISAYVHLFVKNEVFSTFTVVAALCIVASGWWVYEVLTDPKRYG